MTSLLSKESFSYTPKWQNLETHLNAVIIALSKQLRLWVYGNKTNHSPSGCAMVTS